MSNSSNEVLHHAVGRISYAFTLSSVPQGPEDRVVFISTKKIGDDTTGKNVVDKHEELLVHDLRVRQQKGDGLGGLDAGPAVPARDMCVISAF